MTAVFAIARTVETDAVVTGTGPRGEKGDPGGNIMAIGLFAVASGISIPTGTDVVRTSGHTDLGVGVGDYIADAAVDAAYVSANPRTAFISEPIGRGFRLSPHQPLDFAHFGAIAGDVSANGTNNSSAMSALLAFLLANGVYRFTISDLYWFASTIDINQGNLLIEGPAGGGLDGGTAILKFPAGVTGVRIQNEQSSGATTKDASPHSSGSGTVLRNLALQGSFTTTEAEAYGVQLRRKATIENVTISNFEGDGIYISASGGAASGASPPYGNDNVSHISRVSISNCRNGLFFAGTDANACTVIEPNINGCRQWGILDTSFLGNSYFGGQLATNGATAANDGVTIGASVVSSGGNLYGAIVGQETGASTNAPSGTTANNTWWYYIGAGAPVSGKPAWTSGMLVRAGGAVRASSLTGNNLFSGVYAEGDQGKAQLVQKSLVVGGILSSWCFQNPSGSNGAALIRGDQNSGVVAHVEPCLAVVSGSVTTQIGHTAGNTLNIIWNAIHPTFAAAGYQLQFAPSFNGDIRFTFSGGSANAWWVTLPGTAQQFGTGAIVPHAFCATKLMVQGNSESLTNARRVMMDSAPPASGAHARGEIVFNNSPSVGAPKGWQCTVAGTPGTWVSMGNL